MITLNEVKNNIEISVLIDSANKLLEAMGYTEHGKRHMGYVSKACEYILRSLGHDERTVELGAIAGWVHDIGNSVNRKYHGLTGANLIYPILYKIGMEVHEICRITSAIGNHEEEYGHPISEIAAALIIADKADAHRTRVRKGRYSPSDIHDRVNYAIKESKLVVDADNRVISLHIEMDNTSSLMEFFQIYMSRMVLSEKAAIRLGCNYQIIYNGQTVTSTPFDVCSSIEAMTLR